jgi:hypothetical protein
VPLRSLLLNGRRGVLSFLARFFSLDRERLAKSTCSGNLPSLGGKTSTWTTKMSSRALPAELMNRITLENTEEAEVVDAAEVFDKQVQRLFLCCQVLVINLFLGRRLLLFAFFDLFLV